MRLGMMSPSPLLPHVLGTEVDGITYVRMVRYGRRCPLTKACTICTGSVFSISALSTFFSGSLLNLVDDEDGGGAWDPAFGPLPLQDQDRRHLNINEEQDFKVMNTSRDNAKIRTFGSRLKTVIAAFIARTRSYNLS